MSGISLLSVFSVHAQHGDYHYSIKNRWSVKASISRYKTALLGDGYFAHVGDFFLDCHNRKMANFKVEANYGITKFMEVGLFTGFQHYEFYDYRNAIFDEETGEITGSTVEESFAPLFGVTVNFHILPFLVKSKNCHWDLYLTAKYGGCYLPYREYEGVVDDDYFYGKYRHEYGLGAGAGYYIKNIIGFYAEASVGQYAFFPSLYVKAFFGPDFTFSKDYTSLAESNFSFRIGIAVKINK